MYLKLTNEIKSIVESGAEFECHSVIPTNCRNENRNHNVLNDFLDKFVREDVSVDKFEYGLPEKFPNIILTPKDEQHMSLYLVKDAKTGEVGGELRDYQHYFKFKPMKLPDEHPFVVARQSEKE